MPSRKNTEIGKKDYELSGQDFIICDYDRQPAFTSFLPGIAGVKGIPLWAFYVNRGQCITSFGVHDKNNALMEFFPANAAYENTALKGFRTFIKADGRFTEPFSPSASGEGLCRSMHIRRNQLMIEETNSDTGIKIGVKYFLNPNDDFGALVRRVRVENISARRQQLELLDGMPKITPYGIKNDEYKQMSNLFRSWMEVANIENGVPFYNTRSSVADEAEVGEVKGGYFYLSFSGANLLQTVYDPNAVFGEDTSLILPSAFLSDSFVSGLETQCFANKVPCGFSYLNKTLEPGESLTFTTFIGFAGSPEEINSKLSRIANEQYAEEKWLEAETVVSQFTKDVCTKTGNPVFDQYIEQSYLDNFLRGGYPFVFNQGDNQAVVHLFSRKHGDPERDYNFFSTAGEYYSQGNGNFRDVSQNRRNDVFFHPAIGDYNIKTFYSLIQADGYNPLEVRGATFSVLPENRQKLSTLLDERVATGRDKLDKLLSGRFTPGQVINTVFREQIKLTGSDEELLGNILLLCKQNIEAGYTEGYWSDHWDYNLDLVESYLSVFPEKYESLLFDDDSYTFFDSPVFVRPRAEKYTVKGGKVRQYNAVTLDEEKLNSGYEKNGTSWMKASSGELYTTNLFGKMLVLAINKFSSLDPYGMGIEMEANKPGWNDAMNGLPGLIGSGMSETFELQRQLEFLRDACRKNRSTKVAVELCEFADELYGLIQKLKAGRIDQFAYWDQSSAARESYRQKVRKGYSGKEKSIDTASLLPLFEAMLGKIEDGIKRATPAGKIIPPTYFVYEATNFEIVTAEDGMKNVAVHAFEQKELPYFLEGPAKQMKLMKNADSARELYHEVKESELFDRKLGMYKTSVPIDSLSMEFGRIRAFTPGWLERESVFLHMEYKYLLGLLQAGLYDEFFEDMKHAFIPFLSPQTYGRSILENSSFIASSRNPDPAVHGRGFVSRLSGSTTEVLSMWIHLFYGPQFFKYAEGALELSFSPRLPGWLFDQSGKISAQFLSSCKVTYFNPKRLNTYGECGAKIKSIELLLPNGETMKIEGGSIKGEHAEKIRDGAIPEIKVYLD